MNDNRPEDHADLQKLVGCACQAAANALAGRGIPAEDIANGMIAFGGAIAMDLVGGKATAEIFQSKADVLRKSVVQ